MRQVQFEPMTFRVRATGQSAVFCFCMAPFYLAITLLAIDFEKNSHY